jgi:hypothetical protein
MFVICPREVTLRGDVVVTYPLEMSEEMSRIQVTSQEEVTLVFA